MIYGPNLFKFPIVRITRSDPHPGNRFRPLYGTAEIKETLGVQKTTHKAVDAILDGLGVCDAAGPKVTDSIHRHHEYLMRVAFVR